MLSSVQTTALVGLLSTFAHAMPSSPPSELVARNTSTACNNSPSLCSKPYNQVTYMGAHDSSFLRDPSTQNSIAGTQYESYTKALDAGLRFLQTQAHDLNGTLQLCHGTCDLLDAGSVESFLIEIGDWMGRNPNEVVTLLFVNSDSKDVSEWGSVFEKSGVTKYSYKGTAQGATAQWPTLQNMIDENQRLVSFVTDVADSTQYPYIRDEFDYIFETAYQVTGLDGFNCTLDRPSREGSATAALGANYMSLVNHFKYQTITTGVYVPDPDSIDVVNSADTSTVGNLGKHLQQCKSEWSSPPNFVLVDFWNNGDVVKAADAMNGVTDATGRTAVPADDNDDESAATGRGSDLGKCALLTAVAACLYLL